MLSKLNIFEIRKDAIVALKKDANDFSFYIFYYVVPLGIATGLHLIKYEVDTGLFGKLISGISLFTGLLFTIIFIVANNLNQRKSIFNTNNEEDINYIKRYKAFASDLVALVSYTVVKCVLIIVVLLLSDAYYEYLDKQVNLLLRFIWDYLLILLYQFLLLIIIILKDIYSMQYDDINIKNK